MSEDAKEVIAGRTESPWDDHAAGWDGDPIVFAYAEAAFASLRAAVSVSATQRVLDFGCGTGLLTERLAPHVREVVAVDGSSAMIEVLSAKALPNVQIGMRRWTPQGMRSDPLASAPFDLVVCSSVCAFVDDYPATVAMLATHLAVGGHFVQWDWEYDPTADEPFGLTRQAMREALASAGLDVVAVGIGFDVPVEGHLMRPLMAVGRRAPP